MDKLFYFDCLSPNEHTAANKAVEDVKSILQTLGARPLPAFENKIPSLFRSIFALILCPSRSGFLLQLPIDFLSRVTYFAIAFLKHVKHIKVIALIHDIDELRNKPLFYERETYWRHLIHVADAYIVHNSRMSEWMIQNHNIPRNRLTALDLFDYLYSGTLPRQGDSVAIAGSLARDKCPYIYSLKNIPDVQWNLFGPNCEVNQCTSANVRYAGVLPPHELTAKLEARFGLIWDGDSVDTCSGPHGEYLRYNNPHKLSLYLASGLPVIVWCESAVADFVQRHNVGLSVRSLHEVPGRLNSLSNDDYAHMRHAAAELGKKAREGGFLKAALKRAYDKASKM